LLPKANIRGLSLPCDSDSYYICFTPNKYYKRRFFDESKGKYRCPSGHAKPLFIADDSNVPYLLIEEGELNALSMVEVGCMSVVSPGGVGDFDKSEYLDYYKNYKYIAIIVDHDAAGASAAIKLYSKLVKHTPYIKVSMWSEDANELLQQPDGKDRLKQKVDYEIKTLEMSSRLS